MVHWVVLGGENERSSGGKGGGNPSTVGSFKMVGDLQDMMVMSSWMGLPGT